jgi:hypothetical protein
VRALSDHEVHGCKRRWRDAGGKDSSIDGSIAFSSPPDCLIAL